MTHRLKDYRSQHEKYHRCKTRYFFSSLLNANQISKTDLIYGISETPEHGVWGSAIFNGTAAGETVTGDANANRLFGAGGDDILIGGAGWDQLDGEAGWDMASYSTATAAVIVDRSNLLLNTGDAGGDTYTSIERFQLTAFNDRFVGNADGEFIYGGAGNDTILSGNGDDWIYGGAGADSMDGGAGWDVVSYDQSASGVVVDRINPANNTGDAAGDSFANIERFILTNSADVFVGDGSNEAISGGSGNDTINGGGGNDLIVGEADNDLLTGGLGNDTVQFTAGFGKDIVTDFSAGTGVGDVLQFSLGTAFDTFAELMAAATQVGANTVITIDANNTITLNNVTKTTLVADDFAFF